MLGGAAAGAGPVLGAAVSAEPAVTAEGCGLVVAAATGAVASAGAGSFCASSASLAAIVGGTVLSGLFASGAGDSPNLATKSGKITIQAKIIILMISLILLTSLYYTTTLWKKIRSLLKRPLLRFSDDWKLSTPSADGNFSAVPNVRANRRRITGNVGDRRDNLNLPRRCLRQVSGPRSLGLSPQVDPLTHVL